MTCGCAGKAAYVTKSEGRSALRRAHSLRLYHCGGCGLWHATSMVKQVFKRTMRQMVAR